MGKSFCLWLFILFSSLFILSSNFRFYTADELAQFRLTESMISRRGISIETAGSDELLRSAAIKGPDNRYYPKAGPGYSIALAPFYFAGAMASKIIKTGGDPRVYFASTLNQFAAAAVCVAVFLLLARMGYSAPASVLTAFAAGFCTILWPYARMSMNVVLVSFFLIYAFFYLKKGANPVLAGFFFGSGFLVRPDSMALLPAYILYILLNSSSKEKKASRVFSFIFSLVPFLFIFLWYNFARTGHLLALGYSPDEGFSTPVLAGLSGLLFSSSKSVFIYSPPLLLSVVMFIPFIKKHRAEGIFIVTVFLSSLFFYSAWSDWGGGVSWGPRFLVCATVFMMLPVAEFFDNKKMKKVFMLPGFLALAAGLFIQVLAVSVNSWYYSYKLFLSGVIPREAFGDFSVSPPALQFRLIAGSVSKGLLDNFDFWFIRVSPIKIVFLSVILFAISFSIVKLFCCIKKKDLREGPG